MPSIGLVQSSFALKSFSFTPGFSPVPKGSVYENRFNGFPLVAKETIKMVSQQCQRLSTGLKPGVNETTFEAKPFRVLHAMRLYFHWADSDPASSTLRRKVRLQL